jgi:hypothetical protein
MPTGLGEYQNAKNQIQAGVIRLHFVSKKLNAFEMFDEMRACPPQLVCLL